MNISAQTRDPHDAPAVTVRTVEARSVGEEWDLWRHLAIVLHPKLTALGYYTLATMVDPARSALSAEQYGLDDRRVR